MKRRRRHRNGRGHAARRGRSHAPRALGRGRDRHRRRRGAVRGRSIRSTTSRARRRAAPTASPSSRWPRRTRRSTEAGWADGAPYAPERIGCILGTGIGGIETLEDNFDVLHDAGPRRCRAARGAADDGQRRRGRDRDAPRPARPGVRRRLGLRRGRERDRRAPCARSSAATPTRSSPAAREAALTPLARAAFAALDATSHDRRSAVRSTPRRDGFVMGEGAGVLVLEDADARPRARCRRSSAIVRGFGTTCDAHHLTAPAAPTAPAPPRRSPRRCATPASAPDDDRLRQRPRHLDAAQRPRRDRSRSRPRSASTRTRIPISSTKSAIGPPARRRRRRRGDRDDR